MTKILIKKELKVADSSASLAKTSASIQMTKILIKKELKVTTWNSRQIRFILDDQNLD